MGKIHLKMLGIYYYYFFVIKNETTKKFTSWKSTEKIIRKTEYKICGGFILLIGNKGQVEQKNS